jgi:hypothetical protein
VGLFEQVPKLVLYQRNISSLSIKSKVESSIFEFKDMQADRNNGGSTAAQWYKT